MTRGDKFRKAVLEEFDFNQAESLLVDEISAVIDTIDGLPADDIVERRMQRTLLSRLLGQLALPELPGDQAGDSKRPTVTSIKARKAARARWGQAGGGS